MRSIFGNLKIIVENAHVRYKPSPEREEVGKRGKPRDPQWLIDLCDANAKIPLSHDRRSTVRYRIHFSHSRNVSSPIFKGNANQSTSSHNNQAFNLHGFSLEIEYSEETSHALLSDFNSRLEVMRRRKFISILNRRRSSGRIPFNMSSNEWTSMYSK